MTTVYPVALAAIRAAQEQGALRDIDVHLALHLLSAAELPDDSNTADVALAIAMLSRAQADGHVCLALPDATAKKSESVFTTPALAAWRKILRTSPLVSAAESIDNETSIPTPLVLDNADRLYFAKYFRFEQSIANRLRLLASAPSDVAEEDINHALDALFGNNADPHQREAAGVALRRRLAVITGGPGTGKTWTVTQVLLALIAHHGAASTAPLRVSLAAPTGKAAARINESLRNTVAGLEKGAQEKGDAALLAQLAQLPAKAQTLHSLVGTRPGTRRTRHDVDNPLSLDVLVIDEASMIDVPLMARTLAALPPKARLVLLGDSHQLASVEAGAVLGNICEAPAQTATRKNPPAIAACVTELQKSRRFDDKSAIGALARAINAGDAAAARAVFNAQREDVTFVASTGDGLLAPSSLIEQAVREYRSYLSQPDPVAALQAFDNYRVLCALRDGPRGVTGINARITRALANAGLVNPHGTHWHGQPILVTTNDPATGLYNGDIGLVWEQAPGSLRAWFPADAKTARSFSLLRLPAHETVFAMTVHKSQGSEFDQVAFVLPALTSGLLSRELVYTAVTRAKTGVTLFGDSALLDTAISRKVERSSGLRDALWE